MAGGRRPRPVRWQSMPTGSAGLGDVLCGVMGTPRKPRHQTGSVCLGNVAWAGFAFGRVEPDEHLSGMTS
jgi:hypothetical protein